MESRQCRSLRRWGFKPVGTVLVGRGDGRIGVGEVWQVGGESGSRSGIRDGRRGAGS